MTKVERELCEFAYQTIADMLAEGREQGHIPDAFAWAPGHLDRAMRHFCTHRLMRDGHQAPDAEGAKGHLQRAVTRAVMALYQFEKGELT